MPSFLIPNRFNTFNRHLTHRYLQYHNDKIYTNIMFIIMYMNMLINIQIHIVNKDYNIKGIPHKRYNSYFSILFIEYCMLQKYKKLKGLFSFMTNKVE